MGCGGLVTGLFGIVFPLSGQHTRVGRLPPEQYAFVSIGTDAEIIPMRPIQLQPRKLEFRTCTRQGTPACRQMDRGGLSYRHCGEARAKLRSLAKSIDRLEWMREQMLTLQRALERVELDKRRQQIQSPTLKLKVKQF